MCVCVCVRACVSVCVSVSVCAFAVVHNINVSVYFPLVHTTWLLDQRLED